MIVVDSTIWNAAKSKRDKMHIPATKILENVMTGTYGKPLITDYIVDEVLTWLNARATHELAVEAADFFFQGGQVEVIKVDWAIIREAYELFKKHDFLSFTDATTCVLLDAYKIRAVATFDDDFAKLGFRLVKG